MNLRLAYLGRSAVVESGRAQTFSLAPNLSREPVAFDAALRQPIRFREAMSALHDVVASDLRYKKRDKSPYLAWKKEREQQRRAEYASQHREAIEAIAAAREQPVSPDLHSKYRACLKQYWSARQNYANYLLAHDRDLWRMLMPCDPVITVADDALLFECFSADESSYGCLSVDRAEGFYPATVSQYGTTNVDYSQTLYQQFQSLRTYRETRFRIDPAGFEVATEGNADFREEKIDLPAGWLRGFMQIQAAMTMPGIEVRLSREALYSLLVWYKRHRARTSPRAMRFELTPGAPPKVVLEPWETPIISHATRYTGPQPESIRIWGVRRLLCLARIIPLVDHVDVHLIGTGLPSFWIAHMGEMRLVLGLSGWTTNDWTRGAAIDLLAPPVAPPPDIVETFARIMRLHRLMRFEQLRRDSAQADAVVRAALRHLAYSGQIISDLGRAAFRWRQVMPQALGEAEMGPPDAEATGAIDILARKRVKVGSRAPASGGASRVEGTADGLQVEVIVDSDGRIRGGKCKCSHYFKNGLRKGPCRHLLALRWLEFSRMH